MLCLLNSYHSKPGYILYINSTDPAQLIKVYTVCQGKKDLHTKKDMLSYPGCHVRTVIGCTGTHAHGHQVMSMFNQSDVIIVSGTSGILS